MIIFKEKNILKLVTIYKNKTTLIRWVQVMNSALPSNQVLVSDLRSRDCSIFYIRADVCSINPVLYCKKENVSYNIVDVVDQRMPMLRTVDDFKRYITDT